LLSNLGGPWWPHERLMYLWSALFLLDYLLIAIPAIYIFFCVILLRVPLLSRTKAIRRVSMISVALLLCSYLLYFMTYLKWVLPYYKGQSIKWVLTLTSSRSIYTSDLVPILVALLLWAVVYLIHVVSLKASDASKPVAHGPRDASGG
jgi:hypothetical protein